MTSTVIIVSSQLVARPGYVRTGKRFKPDKRPPYEQRRDAPDGSIRYVDHYGFEHVWRDQRGPWWESISCALLPTEGRIHKPFEIDGRFYVAMGVGPRGTDQDKELCEAWRVIRLAEWKTEQWGRPTDYHAKTKDQGGAFARRDPRGFYHRMTAKCGKETWVFLGPAVTLLVDDNPHATQLTLFDFTDE